MTGRARAGFQLPEMDEDLAGDDAREPSGAALGDVVPGLTSEPGPGTSGAEARTGSDGSGRWRRNRRAGSGTGSQNQPDEAPGKAPERIGPLEFAWLAVLAWARRSAQDHKRHRSFGHWVWNAWFGTQPDALISFVKYAWSDSWVKEELTGWLRTAARWEYRIYALLIGGPLVQAGNGLSRIGARQSRFWVAVVIAGAAFGIYSLHH